MEKKTIGKFISALRKANGMTQKELGEKLYVSDKTVSRWERDECAPELSLIPVIAELFGITTDELLRGERNNPDKAVTSDEEVVAKQKAKSDKQFRAMLYNRLKKYNNLTLISIGISLVGLIAAMIANFAFYKALVGLGIVTACVIAGEICQLCFAANARLMLDEDDDSYHDKIREANTKIARTAVWVTLYHIVLWVFCLPLIRSEYGLPVETWLPLGLGNVWSALIKGCLAYVLFVRLILAKLGVFQFTELQKKQTKQESKLLGKLLLIGLPILLLVVSFANTFEMSEWAKEYEFDDPYEFKTFVEDKLNEWFLEEYDHSLDVAIASGDYLDGITLDICRVTDAEGNMVEVYYNMNVLALLGGENFVDESSVLQFEMPATVVLKEDEWKVQTWVNIVASVIAVVDLAACIGIYFVGRRKIYRTK